MIILYSRSRMADLLLSPVLYVIIEKLTTHTRERIGNRWNVEDNIKKLQHTLAKVQSILEDAEEQQASNTTVRVWSSKFREVALVLKTCFSFSHADLLTPLVLSRP